MTLRYGAVQVLAELGSGYSEVLTSRDVAVYGTLCALACFDRDELYYLVIKNLPFREVLEGHLDVRTLLSSLGMVVVVVVVIVVVKG